MVQLNTNPCTDSAGNGAQVSRLPVKFPSLPLAAGAEPQHMFVNAKKLENVDS